MEKSCVCVVPPDQEVSRNPAPQPRGRSLVAAGKLAPSTSEHFWALLSTSSGTWLYLEVESVKGGWEEFWGYFTSKNIVRELGLARRGYRDRGWGAGWEAWKALRMSWMTSQKPAGGLGGGAPQEAPPCWRRRRACGQGLQAMHNLEGEEEELTGQGLQAMQNLSAAAQVWNCQHKSDHLKLHWIWH